MATFSIVNSLPKVNNCQKISPNPRAANSTLGPPSSPPPIAFFNDAASKEN